MEFIIREEDCKAAIKNYFRSKDFVLEEYKVTPVGSRQLNFLGRGCTLTASVRFRDRLHEIHLFAKLPPVKIAHRSLAKDLKWIHRECIVYSYLAPMLRKCLPKSTTLPIPKCYFLRDAAQSGVFPIPGSADEEIIILEDVCHSGFRALDKWPVLDVHHCRVLLKTLARFHAASILCEFPGPDDASTAGRSSPEEGLPFLEDLWERKISDSMATACARTMTTAATEIWPEKFAGEKQSVAETLRESWESVSTVRRDFPELAKVMCHGSTWASNLMFSYESNGTEVPVDCVLVNLHGMHYAPPVMDIHLFLHTCTTREFRDKYADSLLEYYHYKLGDFVGSDLLDAAMPLHTLLKSYSDLKVVGLVVSTAYLSVVLEEEDATSLPKMGGRFLRVPLEISDMVLKDRGRRIAANCKASTAYGDRVLGCFQECLECLGLWN